ncbi:hypothetical protein [Shewanella maritima]|uniref:hypothetical protein n=1 Tax=Shewanella maritima TaxID=2520507 RepID=UPI003737079D
MKHHDNQDTLSRFEAMDRAFIQLSHLESALGQHPVITSDPKAKQLYDNALESLAVLYQRLSVLNNEQQPEDD